MVRILALGIVLSFGALAGCEKKDRAEPKSEAKEKTEPAVAALQPFLKSSDFVSDAISFLAPEEVYGALNELDALYVEAPDEGIDMNHCLSSIKGSVVEKSRIVFAGEVEVAQCLSEVFRKSLEEKTGAVIRSLTMPKAGIRIFWERACAGTDLSDLAGKTIAEADALADAQGGELCPGEATQMSLRMNLEMSLAMEASLELQGETHSFRSGSTIRSAWQTAEGQPCQKMKSGDHWEWGDGCQALDLGVVTEDSQNPTAVGSADHSKLTFSGIREPVGSRVRYYSAGEVKILLNGWEGAATYSDAATPPVWSLSKDGQTVTGTLGAARLRLASRFFYPRGTSQKRLGW